MPLGIRNSGRLEPRAINGAAGAADRREGALVDGAADADLLVDSRVVRVAPRAELRQRRRLARRGRRPPSGAGRGAQYEFGAGGSTGTVGAHDAGPARWGASVPTRGVRDRNTRGVAM